MAVKLAKKEPRKLVVKVQPQQPSKLAVETKPRAKPTRSSRSLPALGVKYVRSMLNWVWHGKPTRSEREINKLLAICQQCEFFKDKGPNSYCDLCGCCVGAKQSGWHNKLAARTESCPKGKW